MIPGWKLRRELDRLGQQARAIGAYAFEGAAQRKYDAAFPSQLTITDGTAPLTQKLAVFLIYQPGDILASTLRECAHLIDHGYSPLIISNCPLTQDAAAALQKVSWKTVQRPNYGYDFGGYRDGIRLLDHLDISPDTLLVLNDSIWFPLHDHASILTRLEAMPENVAGLVYHEDLTKRSAMSRPKSFLESYFFRFDKTALSNPGFKDYWTNYRVSSNKYNAVYRGERAICDHMRSAGLTVAGVINRQALRDALATQTPAFLRKTLSYGAYTDDDLRAESIALLAAYKHTPDWQVQAVAHVAKTTLRRNLHASFCYASMILFGMTSLKKSNGTFLKGTYATLHSEARTQYLAAVAAGDLPAPFPEIIPEVTARQQNLPQKVPA